MGRQDSVLWGLYESVDDFLQRRPGYDAQRLREGIQALENQSTHWSQEHQYHGLALSAKGEARRLLFLAAVLIKTQEIHKGHLPRFLAEFTAAL